MSRRIVASDSMKPRSSSLHRFIIGGAAAIAVTGFLLGAANAAAILVFDTFYGPRKAHVSTAIWLWPVSHVLAAMAVGASIVMYLVRGPQSTVGNLLAAASVLLGVILGAVWMMLDDTMLAATTFGAIALYGVLHRGLRNAVWPRTRPPRTITVKKTASEKVG